MTNLAYRQAGFEFRMNTNLDKLQTLTLLKNHRHFAVIERLRILDLRLRGDDRKRNYRSPTPIM